MQRYCLTCEVDWDDPTHRRAVRRDVGSDWRGNPGQMVPHRQWTRENLPDSGQRLSVAGDDGFSPLRHYPSACCCGLPEQPLVAKRIDVQWHPIGGEPIRRTDITPAELVAGILAFIQWEAA